MPRSLKWRDFEKRFDTMSVEELKRWEIYWTQHAQSMAPKGQKLAMKTVYRVQRAIELRLRDASD